MNQNIDSTEINSRKKKLFEEKIASILFESYHSPFKIYQNGAFALSNDKFVLNKRILAARLGININSVNKNLKHHDLRCIQKFPVESKTNLPDPKGWKIYKHSNPDFTMDNILKGNKQLTTKWIAKDSKCLSENANLTKTKLPNINILLSSIQDDSYPQANIDIDIILRHILV